jgi:predicted HicB family RNase H-like nuclease
MFKIQQNEQTVNKTFRLPVKLMEELTRVAAEEKISVNNLVRQCCEYALNNMKADRQ